MSMAATLRIPLGKLCFSTAGTSLAGRVLTVDHIMMRRTTPALQVLPASSTSILAWRTSCQIPTLVMDIIMDGIAIWCALLPTMVRGQGSLLAGARTEDH